MAPRGRRAAPQRAPRPALIIALVLASAGVAIAVGAWAFGEDDGRGSGTRPFRDIHGLAVDRDDPGALYVATHHGLFHGSAETGWAPVGATRDDLMGFAAHPTDPETFWSSGHPAQPTMGNSNLGVRKSVDGGRTWQPLALPGVDFHAMTVSPAQPDRLWGIYRGALHRTDDGGATWSVVAEPAPRAYSLAAHPNEPDVLLAATPDGIVRSVDGGATWAAHGALVAYGIGFDPNAPQTVYAAADSRAHRSDDGGATWRPLALDVPNGLLSHVAVSPHDGDVVYVASTSGIVHKSTDGGATWTRIAGA